MFSVIQNAMRWHADAHRTDDSSTSDDRTEGGFSLIELLVVVMIIGILAAIAVPIYLTVQNSAKDSQVQSDLVAAKTLMVAAYADKGSYPTTIAQLKAAGFAPTAKTSDGYVVNWQMFNVSDNGFCLRAWADRPDEANDLWVSGSSGVVGPIPVDALAQRPEGCPK